MFARKFAVSLLVGTTLLAAPMSAQACGVFGTEKCSLIRGWVGERMKPVQEKILTPALQTAVVVATTAVAVSYAGPSGAPVGAVVGNGVNDLFAGKGGEPDQGAVQQQAAMGSKCATEVAGDFPLSGPAPLGSACSAKLPNGKEFGGKVVP